MKTIWNNHWQSLLVALLVCASIHFTTAQAAQKAADGKADNSAAMTKGAAMGKWTQDYDAALKLAKEKNLPIMLDFTGSDWCPWCQLMDRRVLDTDQWLAYAKNHVVLVKLDFPRNQDLVPEDFRQRNQDLSDQFGIEGYPTYVILASDGKTELGRLGAGRDKTPESFIGEMKDLFRRNPVAIDKRAKELSPELAKKYRDALNDMEKAQEQEEAWMAAISEETPAVTKKMHEYEMKIAADKDTAYTIEVEHMMSKLDKAKAAKVGELLKEELAAKKALRAWAYTNPPQTPENDAKYKQLTSDIEKPHLQIQSYWP